jgi:hypothetical protein
LLAKISTITTIAGRDFAVDDDAPPTFAILVSNTEAAFFIICHALTALTESGDPLELFERQFPYTSESSAV